MQPRRARGFAQERHPVRLGSAQMRMQHLECHPLGFAYRSLQVARGVHGCRAAHPEQLAERVAPADQLSRGVPAHRSYPKRPFT